MERSVGMQNSDESSDIDDKFFFTSPEVCEIADSVKSQLLPAKSRAKYEAVYLTYANWKKSKNINLTSENVLNAYFEQLSEKYKPPTLWSSWSMLKSTINTKEQVDITEYKQLTAFLKNKSDGYKGKKSKELSLQEVETFLKEAPQNKYLATKVALIFGICGACGREELANMKLDDIKHQGEILVVKIPDRIKKLPRTFIIEDEFTKIVRVYESLRPPNMTSNRFFINYQNGKCTSQVIGKNKFGAMPKQIAEYLNLPDPKLYTGHSFRRTSASLLANSEVDLIMLQRDGGWKSSTVAEEYIKDSVNNKRRIGHMITLSTSIASSTSDERIKLEVPTLKKIKQVNMVPTTLEDYDNSNNISDSTVNIENENKNPVFQFQNCTVNIHYHQ